jgi:putative membrane protein
MNTDFSLILTSLGTGLPVLLLHFVVTLLLLALGVACYVRLTPFQERALIGEGNVAAGIVLAGAIVGLAVPLAATLATSLVLLDIIIWGVIALLLQLVTFAVATLLFRGLRQMIEAGNIAAAVALAGVQLAVALLNAGAMAG